MNLFFANGISVLFLSLFWLTNLFGDVASSRDFVKGREESLMEFVRFKLQINPEVLKIFSQYVAEKYLESNGGLGQQITRETIESFVQQFFLSEQFLKERLSVFDEFSDEEVQSLLSLCETEQMKQFMRKMQACENAAYFGMLHVFDDPQLRSELEKQMQNAQ